jgi:hypothetical protein
MDGMVDPARKDEFVKRPAPTLKPSLNADAAGFKDFELNRGSRLATSSAAGVSDHALS